MRFVQLGRPFQQTGMQIEHIPRIGLAPRRTTQQQRHLAIGDRLLGQIVIEDHRMHAMVAEVFSHGTTRVGRDELQRGRLGGRGRDDDGIGHGAIVFQRLHHLGHGRAFLSHRDIDAKQLAPVIAARLVPPLLVEDRIDDNGRLAGLAIADDQLALPPANGNQAVDGLEASLHGFVHRSARDDAGGLDIGPSPFARLNRPLAVDGSAEGIHHPPQKALAHRHVDDGARAADRIAFANAPVFPEHDDAHVVVLEVQRHALDAAGKFHHFAGLNVIKPIDAGDAVADR